jgi:hypothetical protein
MHLLGEQCEVSDLAVGRRFVRQEDVEIATLVQGYVHVVVEERELPNGRSVIIAPNPRAGAKEDTETYLTVDRDILVRLIIKD